MVGHHALHDSHATRFRDAGRFGLRRAAPRAKLPRAPRATGSGASAAAAAGAAAAAAAELAAAC
eukprot:scaffold73363_cov60-Phaeocystis_antarctica.AAC.11